MNKKFKRMKKKKKEKKKGKLFTKNVTIVCLPS